MQQALQKVKNERESSSAEPNQNVSEEAIDKAQNEATKLESKPTKKQRIKAKNASTKKDVIADSKVESRADSKGIQAKGDEKSIKADKALSEQGIKSEDSKTQEIIKEPTKLAQIAQKDIQKDMEEQIESKQEMQSLSDTKTKTTKEQKQTTQNTLNATAAQNAGILEAKQDNKDKKRQTSKTQTNMQESKIQDSKSVEQKDDFASALKNGLLENEMQELEQMPLESNLAPKQKGAKKQTNKEQNIESKTQQASAKSTSEAPQSIQNNARMQTLYRSHEAKESLKNFSSALKEEIANYKPPITKLSMELNPQNLGTLEVSVSKKGKDLVVQVLSNNNAIGLFLANQAEFKNSLNNIGFSNVELSFAESSANGSNQKGQGGDSKNRNTSGGSANSGNENGLEQSQMEMTITLPKYA